MIRPISIRAVLNGFVCTVGCQEVVFDSKERLVLALAQYLDHPARFEKEFTATACNGMQDSPLVIGGGSGSMPGTVPANGYTDREQNFKCADEPCQGSLDPQGYRGPRR